jgi:hypothetical protein
MKTDVCLAAGAVEVLVSEAALHPVLQEAKRHLVSLGDAHADGCAIFEVISVGMPSPQAPGSSSPQALGRPSRKVAQVDVDLEAVRVFRDEGTFAVNAGMLDEFSDRILCANGPEPRVSGSEALEYTPGAADPYAGMHVFREALDESTSAMDAGMPDEFSGHILCANGLEARNLCTSGSESLQSLLADTPGAVDPAVVVGDASMFVTDSAADVVAGSEESADLGEASDSIDKSPDLAVTDTYVVAVLEALFHRLLEQEEELWTKLPRADFRGRMEMGVKVNAFGANFIRCHVPTVCCQAPCHLPWVSRRYLLCGAVVQCLPVEGNHASVLGLLRQSLKENWQAPYFRECMEECEGGPPSLLDLLPSVDASWWQ